MRTTAIIPQPRLRHEAVRGPTTEVQAAGRGGQADETRQRESPRVGAMRQPETRDPRRRVDTFAVSSKRSKSAASFLVVHLGK